MSEQNDLLPIERRLAKLASSIRPPDDLKHHLLAIPHRGTQRSFLSWYLIPATAAAVVSCVLLMQQPAPQLQLSAQDEDQLLEEIARSFLDEDLWTDDV